MWKKYWFLGMNRRIENIVSICFSCKVIELVKMIILLERIWDIVEVDCFLIMNMYWL